MFGFSWWRHQMETFSALLAICAGNSPVIGEFPTQRPVTRSFDVFFDLRLNERLNKHSWGWWFETPSCPLWRHCNVIKHFSSIAMHSDRIGNRPSSAIVVELEALVWTPRMCLQASMCIFSNSLNTSLVMGVSIIIFGSGCIFLLPQKGTTQHYIKDL